MAEKATSKKKTSKAVESEAEVEVTPIATEEVVTEAVEEEKKDAVEDKVAEEPSEKKAEEKTKDEKRAEEINEALAPIQELANKVNEITESQKTLEAELSKNSDDAVNLINKEIKKAEQMKQEVEKVLNKPTTKSSMGHMTTWWNGSGFDI